MRKTEIEIIKNLSDIITASFEEIPKDEQGGEQIVQPPIIKFP